MTHKPIRWAKLLLVAMLLLPASQSHADDGTVSGKLHAPDGMPIVGFPVIIEGEYGSIVAATDTQ